MHRPALSCKRRNDAEKKFALVSQFVLPHPQDTPTHSSQGAGNRTVAHYIPRKLLLPVSSIALWQPGVFRTTMPEASIDENKDVLFLEHKVRFAESWLISPPALYSIKPKDFDQPQFSFHIPLGLDCGHYLRPLFPREHVCHTGKYIAPESSVTIYALRSNRKAALVSKGRF